MSISNCFNSDFLFHNFMGLTVLFNFIQPTQKLERIFKGNKGYVK